MDLVLIIAVFRAALAVEDPAVAKESVQSLLNELSKAAGSDAPADAAPAAAAAPPPDAVPPKKEEQPVAAKKPAVVPAPEIPVASTPEVATAPVAASKKSEPKDEMAVVLATRIDNVERDALLERHGARLPKGLRVWASSQPLSVVKSMLESAPEPTVAADRTTPATRGEGRIQASRLPPAEAKQLDQLMGIREKTVGGPKVLDDGRLQIAAMRPSDYLNTLRASKAQNGG